MSKQEDQLRLFDPDIDDIVDIPTEQLMLDPENPRLGRRGEENSQSDLVEILWREMAVNEVALSIAANGFFRSEPLFVIAQNPEETDPQKRRYIAIEGNRRLAAVRLLCDDKLREQVKATDLPPISEKIREQLRRLPAIVYPSRESLWTTVGFRHINGIKPWDSFSKAKYVADVHENYGVSLSEVARKIGDYHSTVKRQYRGYKILEQAEAQIGFTHQDTARNRFFFSHLYTAADQPEFQQFLGIDPETSLRSNPVPGTHLAELGELMTWLYGSRSKGIEPKVRTQNPDLGILREVISNPKSLAALRAGRSLERSFEVAVGDKRRFREALQSAKIDLQTAKGAVTTGYNSEQDSRDTIDEVIAIAESIRKEMREKDLKLNDTSAGPVEKSRKSRSRA